MIDKIKFIIELNGLDKKCRKFETRYPRYYMFNWIREHYNEGISFERIGALFGMNHASVLHGIEQHKFNYTGRYKSLLYIELVDDVKTQLDNIDSIKFVTLESDIIEAETLEDFMTVKDNLINNLYVVKDSNA